MLKTCIKSNNLSGTGGEHMNSQIQPTKNQCVSIENNLFKYVYSVLTSFSCFSISFILISRASALAARFAARRASA